MLPHDPVSSVLSGGLFTVTSLNRSLHFYILFIQDFLLYKISGLTQNLKSIPARVLAINGSCVITPFFRLLMQKRS